MPFSYGSFDAIPLASPRCDVSDEEERGSSTIAPLMMSPGATKRSLSIFMATVGLERQCCICDHISRGLDATRRCTFCSDFACPKGDCSSVFKLHVFRHQQQPPTSQHNDDSTSSNSRHRGEPVCAACTTHLADLHKSPPGGALGAPPLCTAADPSPGIITDDYANYGKSNTPGLLSSPQPARTSSPSIATPETPVGGSPSEVPPEGVVLEKSQRLLRLEVGGVEVGGMEQQGFPYSSAGRGSKELEKDDNDKGWSVKRAIAGVAAVSTTMVAVVSTVVGLALIGAMGASWGVVSLLRGLLRFEGGGGGVGEVVLGDCH